MPWYVYAPGEGRQCAQEVLHLHLLTRHDQLLQPPVTAPAISCSCSLLSLGLMLHHLNCPDTVIRSHEDTSRTPSIATICLLFRDDIRGVLAKVLWNKTTFWQMNQTNLVWYISASLWSSNCVEFIVMSYLQLSRSCRCLCNIYCSRQSPSCSTCPVFSLQIISLSPAALQQDLAPRDHWPLALHWASGHTDIKLHLQLGPDCRHE